MRSKLYVGNLPFSATEDLLMDKFSECGMVSSVKIAIDHNTGRSKGFALVEMSNGPEALDVISMFNGVDCDGQELKISEDKPLPKKVNTGNYANKKGW